MKTLQRLLTHIRNSIVGSEDVEKAEAGRVHTDLIDGRVVPQESWISLLAERSTLYDKIAAAAWSGEIQGSFFGDGGRDGLESVGVVICKLRIEWSLDEEVDAAVGDADGVEYKVSASVIGLSDFSELELLLKIVHVDWSVPATGLLSYICGRELYQIMPSLNLTIC